MARSSVAAGEPLLTLGEEWLMAIGDGRLKVKDAIDWAEARWREGGADATVEALAGCTPSHGEADLHRWVEEQPWRGVLPELYPFKAPVWQRGEQVQVELHCLLPHELFGTLAAKTPQCFRELFGDALERDFWWTELERTAEQSPDDLRGREHVRWCAEHPCNASEPRDRVPLGIHGDAGQMHGGEKVMVLSWGGLCRKGSTLDTRLLFACIKDSLMVHEGRKTLFAAFKVLAWSFGSLAAGMHPAKDHEGVPFSAGYFPERLALANTPLVQPEGATAKLVGAWCELRGDWQFLQEALNLRNYAQCTEVCHLCAARKPLGAEPNMRDVRVDGPLRDTLVGPLPWGRRAWSSLHPVSPLCSLPGFSIWRCMFDLMHVLELGLLQRVIPAALHGLLGRQVGKAPPVEESYFAGRNKAARCRKATVMYHEWCKKTGVPSSSIVKAIHPTWCDGKYPHIGMQHAKAAALRAMLPWVAEVAETRIGLSEQQTLRAVCLRALADLDKVYTSQPRFLQPEQEAAAKGHAIMAIQALAQLEELSPTALWTCIPKTHALHHIALDSALGNPRVAHCYQDEDFVGRAKRIYVACHGRTAPRRALERYALRAALALTAREELLSNLRSAKGARFFTRGRKRRAALALRAASLQRAPVLRTADERGVASATAPSVPAEPPTKRGRGRPKTRPAPAPKPRGNPNWRRA